jgi:hypothetical protein
MSNHLLNLALHFVLEIVALVAMGYWGWTTQTGILRWVLVIGLPVVWSILWGTFRIDGEPGKAPIAVRGWVRLLLEGAFFACACGLLYLANRPTLAMVLALVVIIHYISSYDRILRLLREP